MYLNYFYIFFIYFIMSFQLYILLKSTVVIDNIQVQQ